MSSQNQAVMSFDPSGFRRKRGRPRKSESNPNSVIPNPNPNPNGLLGQMVSGKIDGTFDSGYLLTVRVGDAGPILKGLVFDPHISIPLSRDNDVAPMLPMLAPIENLASNANTNPSPSLHLGLSLGFGSTVATPITFAQPLQMREPRVKKPRTSGNSVNMKMRVKLPAGPSDSVITQALFKKSGESAGLQLSVADDGMVYQADTIIKEKVDQGSPNKSESEKVNSLSDLTDKPKAQPTVLDQIEIPSGYQGEIDGQRCEQIETDFEPREVSDKTDPAVVSETDLKNEK